MPSPFRGESLELAVDTVVDAVEVAGLPWCLAIVARRAETASQPLCFALAWNEMGRTRLSSATTPTVPDSLALWYAKEHQQSPADGPVIYREIDLAATTRDAGLPLVSVVERSTSKALIPLRGRLNSVDGYLLTDQVALDSRDGRGLAILGLARRLGYAIDRSQGDMDAFSWPSSPESPARAERLDQARLAAAFHVAGTLALAFNAAGVIESLAGNAEAITGWKPEELIGHSLLELFPVDRQEDIIKTLQSWRAGRDDPVRAHVSLMHRSGRLVPARYAGRPHSVDGKSAGGIGTVTDLSTLMLLRNDLDTARTLQARFQGAVRTGRAVAHELGSPISTIMALTELLADESSLPPDVIADLTILRREALRASDLLHQFGRISRYAEVATPAGPQLDVGTASGSYLDDGVSPNQT